MANPPTIDTTQIAPPAPPGENKMASPILSIKSTTIPAAEARYPRLVQVIKKESKKSANTMPPMIPVSPKTIAGSTPFSIGAENRLILPL